MVGIFTPTELDVIRDAKPLETLEERRAVVAAYMQVPVEQVSDMAASALAYQPITTGALTS
jgi:hypothetical protein